MSAPPSKYQSFLKARNRAMQRHQVAISDEDWQDLYGQCGPRFHGWMMSQIAAYSNGGKHQQAFLTAVTRYMGVSRLGQVMLSRLGVLSTKSYYDKWQKERTKEQEDKIRHVPSLDVCSCRCTLVRSCDSRD